MFEFILYGGCCDSYVYRIEAMFCSNLLASNSSSPLEKLFELHHSSEDEKAGPDCGRDRKKAS